MYFCDIKARQPFLSLYSFQKPFYDLIVKFSIKVGKEWITFGKSQKDELSSGTWDSLVNMLIC